jgi:hypothetical protein
MEPDGLRALWVVLWLGATMLVLGMPLWPAWREVRRPSDVTPLPVPRGWPLAGKACRGRRPGRGLNRPQARPQMS